MIGRRQASARPHSGSAGRSIWRLLGGHGHREGIRSFFVQMTPREAQRRYDQERILQMARLSHSRSYGFEFIPAQGGCVIAVVPPNHNVDRPARAENTTVNARYVAGI
jgi:hypothetical protein